MKNTVLKNRIKNIKKKKILQKCRIKLLYS